MQENGTGYALLIGINYKNQARHMHLNGAVSDVNDIYRHVTNERKAAYPTENITYLAEEDAIEQNIKGYLERLILKAQPNDFVLFYFAGHGQVNGLLAYDNKVFPSVLLAHYLRSIKAKKVLIVLDCCHSENIAIARDGETKALPLDCIIEDLNKGIHSRSGEEEINSGMGEGRAILAACRSNQKALDIGANGLFTKVLLECLNGVENLKGDGWVRLLDIQNYVHKNVSKRAKEIINPRTNKPWEQDPVVNIEKYTSDFIICAYDIVKARESQVSNNPLDTNPKDNMRNIENTFEDYEENLDNPLNNFTMKAIKGGTFKMGSHADDNTQPIRMVTVNDFYLCETPVTQSLWKLVMGGTPPTSNRNSIDTKNPVIAMSWIECQNFIKDLNEKTGKHYRLPTEAEWEYAARANTKYYYSGSDDGDEVAWHARNSHGHLHPVKSKKSNAWGLYDMSGNAREVCEDDYHSNYVNAPLDGSAWLNGESKTINKVIRSGSIHNAVEESRVTKRLGWDGKPLIVGFRLAHSVIPQLKEEPITTPYNTIEKKNDKSEVKVVDSLEAFKAKLRQLLDEEQQNAIPEVVKSIKASVYTYDKVQMTALAGATPMQMALMANEFVRSCALLIESIKEKIVEDSQVHINTSPPPSSFPLAEVQKLVGNAKLDKAIELTLANIPTNDNMVVLSLQGRLKELKQKEMLGTISNSDANLERNNITVALLTFIKGV